MIKTLAFVALGGALGASARYIVGVLATHWGGGQFPWGTFSVNIVGSFLLGVLAGLMTFTWSPSPELRAFLVVGVLGGFTTFSAFSLDTLRLVEAGRITAAGGYVVASVILSIAACAMGLWLAKGITT